MLFLIASLAVILTPGQDLFLVMSRSISQGAGAGAMTAAGVSSGLLVHTLLATVGVGAIVQASEWLFTAMKIVGAAYLLYLGVSLLRAGSSELLAEESKARPLFRLFIDGAVSNIANPKIAIFFFAFLPQFLAPGAENPTLLIFILGVGFAVLTMLVKGAVALFSGQLSGWFRQKPVYLKSLYRVSGVVLVALGVRLLFEKRV
jgi:threonine/homoserine/homoserine lactone efflux protein